MKRTVYKEHIIDKDDLGRVYIYNTESPYSEDIDHILIDVSDFKVDRDAIKAAKAIIDYRIETGRDARNAYKTPDGQIYISC